MQSAFFSSNMLSKFRAMGFLRHLLPRKSRVYVSDGDSCLVNGVLRFFCNTSCEKIEPNNIDEAPKAHESPEFRAAGSDDDFVFPSLADWVENQELQDLGRVGVVISTPDGTTTGGTDVDRISKVLKKGFPSPEAVGLALNGCSVNVSESLVEQLLKRFSSDKIAALGIFNWAKAQESFVHSPELYNAMIDVLGKREECNLMWELVEEMEKVGHSVTSVTMTYIIQALVRAGRWTDAIDAFRWTDRFGIGKDITLLNTLMSSLVNQSGVKHAGDVFLEFKNQIPPDIRTFNILINGWCKIRRLDMARKTIEGMEEHGCRPNVVSYNSLIKAHGRDKDFSSIDSILQEMQEKGCPPTAVTYTIIMYSRGKAKETDEAVKVFEKMKQEGCDPDTTSYGTLIHILGEAGRLNDARDMFEDMKKQGLSPDVKTYNAMIDLSCLHSQEENALKLLQEMEATSCQPDRRTYAPLLRMCCSGRRMKILYFLLGHMLKNDVSFDTGTYTLLVNGLSMSEKLEHACLFFEESVMKGWVPANSTFKLLMKELEKKNMKEAMEMIEKLMLRTRQEASSPQAEQEVSSPQAEQEVSSPQAEQEASSPQAGTEASNPQVQSDLV